MTAPVGGVFRSLRGFNYRLSVGADTVSNVGTGIRLTLAHRAEPSLHAGDPLLVGAAAPHRHSDGEDVHQHQRGQA